MNAEQRFCPVCNRVFVDGEAVLRCGGCGVMHHPSCWVRNRGCATDGGHEQYAEPIAYVRARPASLPHPAEGTRVRRTPHDAASGDLGQPDDASYLVEDEDEVEGEVDEDDFEDEETSGPPPARRYQAPAPEPARSVRHGRYEPLDTVPVRRPMPRVYRRNPVLRFWYIPLAVLSGGAIAAGVVVLGDRFAGDESSTSPASLSTATATRQASGSPSPATSPSPGSTSSPVASPSPTARQSPSATAVPSVAGGQFSQGMQVVVGGTGDCLRVREAPTTQAQQLSCLPDGTEASVLSGPAEGNGFRWWKIRAEGIVEGWAVEDYLRKKP